MIVPLPMIVAPSHPREGSSAEARLEQLRKAYANVRSATVQTSFRKVWESAESPAVEVDTVTHFERPNRIYCLARRRGQTVPFLTYISDGKKTRRIENGQVTEGEFDPNESLPRAGVTLETLALWQGETMLKPGSKILPHPLTTSNTKVTGLDGRPGWSYLAMEQDQITIFIDPKTGLIGGITVGTVYDGNVGGRVPRYSVRVTKWELGRRFPKGFFKLPEEASTDGVSVGSP